MPSRENKKQRARVLEESIMSNKIVIEDISSQEEASFNKLVADEQDRRASLGLTFLFCSLLFEIISRVFIMLDSKYLADGILPQTVLEPLEYLTTGLSISLLLISLYLMLRARREVVRKDLEAKNVEIL